MQDGEVGMLIDFSFANYRSFKQEQSFSMTRERRFNDGTFGELSTICAVYGANASGKSNFLRALWTMCEMVRNSYGQGHTSSAIPRNPFIDPVRGRNEPSMFLCEFIASDDQRYRYWFRFNDETIIEEELVVYRLLPEGRRSSHASRLFTREGSKMDFGPSFRGPRAQVRKTLELRPNALLLSTAAAAGIESITPAFEFLAYGISFCDASGYADEQERIVNEFNRKTAFAGYLSQLIRYADFGIDAVRSAPVSIDDGIKDAFKQQLREQLGADESKLEQLFAANSGTQLVFDHTLGEGIATLLMGDESRGTIAALSFFSLVLHQLTKSTITLVDEIDTSLHPTLVRELVSLFVDPLTNPKRSQLIFTTHDTSLINVSGSSARIIGADQTWLVEKLRNAESEIYPVTDMHVRTEENIGRNYLNGVYGGVPKPDFHTTFARIIDEIETSTYTPTTEEAVA